METFAKETTVLALQDRIFRITDGIQTPADAKKSFLGIMAIRMGREHKVYKDFSRIVIDPEQQFELLQATDKNPYKQDFRVFCHIVLKTYIRQAARKEDAEAPSNQTSEEDPLFEHYFKEVEKCSQETPNLLDVVQIKPRFITLRSLEYSLIKRLLSTGENPADPVVAKEMTAADYRRILTVWLMYPEFIYFPEEIDRIVSLFETGELKLN